MRLRWWADDDDGDDDVDDVDGDAAQMRRPHSRTHEVEVAAESRVNQAKLEAKHRVTTANENQTSTT